MVGTVKWFGGDDKTGKKRDYGFITGEDGNDIFVHFTEIAQEGYKSLTKGQTVEYKVGESKKGPMAVDVRVVG